MRLFQLPSVVISVRLVRKTTIWRARLEQLLVVRFDFIEIKACAASHSEVTTLCGPKNIRTAVSCLKEHRSMECDTHCSSTLGRASLLALAVVLMPPVCLLVSVSLVHHPSFCVSQMQRHVQFYS